MARNDGAESTVEKWELTRDMLLEEEEQRKAPKGGSRATPGLREWLWS